jgi:hypothetical protein
VDFSPLCRINKDDEPLSAHERAHEETHSMNVERDASRINPRSTSSDDMQVMSKKALLKLAEREVGIAVNRS